MHIQWLGHSCFKITHEGYAIVLDPYNHTMMRGYGPIETSAQAVLCSHEHGDHNFVSAVRIQNSELENPFVIERLATFHDDVGGAKRGKNSITILQSGAIRVAHLGDLGSLPEDKQLDRLQGLDAMMIPVGGTYTIDALTAKAIVDRTKPNVVIPMHYQGADFGPKVLVEVTAFTSLFDSKLTRYWDSNVIEITHTTPAQIAVLTYVR